jgi:hypothetical protein
MLDDATLAMLEVGTMQDGHVVEMDDEKKRYYHAFNCPFLLFFPSLPRPR